MIEAIVLPWTEIVALHKRGKAFTVAAEAVEIFADSTTQTYIFAVDEIKVQINAHIKQVQGKVTGISSLGALIRSKTAHTKALEELAATKAEYAVAEALVTQLEEAHRATHQTGVVCGKCGEVIQAAITAVHRIGET